MGKKDFLIIIMFLLSIPVFAQVGITTKNPRGVLDLNDEIGTSNYGLVLPMNIASNISNPIGGRVAFGTMIFDSAENCVKYYSRVKNGWSDCIYAKPSS